MSDLKLRPEISFAETFLCSAFAACFAELCTIPLDTAKVRLQLQKKTASGDGVSVSKYRGLMGTVVTIAREEGLWALWNGVIAGLHRQCIYGGLRIGLYDPVKTILVGGDFVGDIPLYQKIFAALLTGAIAIVVANPTDLVKVRLQAEGKLPSGVPRRYYGALDAYCTIVRQEGLGALWTGLGPNIARNAIVNAAELASYDQVKETILKIPGFTDNIFTHILAGLGAGLFAVCIGSPIDVVGFLSPLLLSAKNNSLAAPNISISLYRLTTKVKSRMMGDSAYKNTVDCFIKTLKYEIVPFFTDLLACVILYERQLAFFQ
ncbi:mitochondrial uncoupling protein 2 [Citrus sinensis]|nr:mitochondrial uncoupling protein 2 [Citrus sinensis]